MTPFETALRQAHQPQPTADYSCTVQKAHMSHAQLGDCVCTYAAPGSPSCAVSYPKPPIGYARCDRISATKKELPKSADGKTNRREGDWKGDGKKGRNTHRRQHALLNQQRLRDRRPVIASNLSEEDLFSRAGVSCIYITGNFSERIDQAPEWRHTPSLRERLYITQAMADCSDLRAARCSDR
jgi:hypothetical protein